jgi:hypothetical protein
MNARVQLLVGVATLVFALGASVSFAQFGGRGGMSGGSRGGNRDQGSSPVNRNDRPVQQESDTFEQIEYRLSLLEEDLHLQPGQHASWESFAGKVRAYASDLARARARAMVPPSGGDSGGGGVQHIEQAADSARNRATALDDIAAAAKTLYAGLKPDQKMLADVRIATIVAPQPRTIPGSGSGSDLPDLGSSVRMQR